MATRYDTTTNSTTALPEMAAVAGAAGQIFDDVEATSFPVPLGKVLLGAGPFITAFKSGTFYYNEDCIVMHLVDGAEGTVEFNVVPVPGQVTLTVKQRGNKLCLRVPTSQIADAFTLQNGFDADERASLLASDVINFQMHTADSNAANMVLDVLPQLIARASMRRASVATGASEWRDTSVGGSVMGLGRASTISARALEDSAAAAASQMEIEEEEQTATDRHNYDHRQSNNGNNNNAMQSEVLDCTALDDTRADLSTADGEVLAAVAAAVEAMTAEEEEEDDDAAVGTTAAVTTDGHPVGDDDDDDAVLLTRDELHQRRAHADVPSSPVDPSTMGRAAREASAMFASQTDNFRLRRRSGNTAPAPTKVVDSDDDGAPRGHAGAQASQQASIDPAIVAEAEELALRPATRQTRPSRAHNDDGAVVVSRTSTGADGGSTSKRAARRPIHWGAKTQQQQQQHGADDDDHGGPGSDIGSTAFSASSAAKSTRHAADGDSSDGDDTDYGLGSVGSMLLRHSARGSKTAAGKAVGGSSNRRRSTAGAATSSKSRMDALLAADYPNNEDPARGDGDVDEIAITTTQRRGGRRAASSSTAKKSRAKRDNTAKKKAAVELDDDLAALRRDAEAPAAPPHRTSSRLPMAETAAAAKGAREPSYDLPPEEHDGERVVDDEPAVIAAAQPTSGGRSTTTTATSAYASSGGATTAATDYGAVTSGEEEDDYSSALSPPAPPLSSFGSTAAQLFPLSAPDADDGVANTTGAAGGRSAARRPAPPPSAASASDVKRPAGNVAAPSAARGGGTTSVAVPALFPPTAPGSPQRASARGSNPKRTRSAAHDAVLEATGGRKSTGARAAGASAVGLANASGNTSSASTTLTGSTSASSGVAGRLQELLMMQQREADERLNQLVETGSAVKLEVEAYNESLVRGRATAHEHVRGQFVALGERAVHLQGEAARLHNSIGDLLEDVKRAVESVDTLDNAFAAQHQELHRRVAEKISRRIDSSVAAMR